MALPGWTVTDAGWKMQPATNFLGHTLLAGALHAALRDAGSARIVVVSSGAHRLASFDFDDPHIERRPCDRWARDSPGPPTSCSPWACLAGRRRHHRQRARCRDRPHQPPAQSRRRLHACVQRDGRGRGTSPPPPHYNTQAQDAATSELLAAEPLLDCRDRPLLPGHQEAQVVPADAQGDGVAAHALDTGAADRVWEYAEDTVRAWSKAQ